MEMNEAKTIITEHGIVVDQTVVHKNGRELDALTIGEGTVKPTLYQDHIVNLHNEEEMMEFVHRILDQTPVLDTNDIFTKEYFLSHVVSCVRPVFDDKETLCFPVYGDLQEYFRVFLDQKIHDDSVASVVVQRSHLETLDITTDELRKAARKNLRRQAEIKSMSEILSEIMGCEAPNISGTDQIMYVASTKNHVQGAAVMLLDDLLREFCMERGISSATLIPASINEIILITENHDSEQIDAMIREVNETTVSEMDRLSDHSYTFHV